MRKFVFGCLSRGMYIVRNLEQRYGTFIRGTKRAKPPADASNVYLYSL